MSSLALLQSIVNGLASSGIYICVALGLTLVMSIMGIVQMSHGGMMTLGDYASTLLIIFFMPEGLVGLPKRIMALYNRLIY